MTANKILTYERATQALAANGARVYITSRREDVLKKSAEAHTTAESGNIIPITCDVTKKEDLEKLVKEIESKEPNGIDLLVVAAGVDGERAAPEDSDASKLHERLMKEDPAKWSSTFDTNVTAVYFTTVAFLPLLQASRKEGGKGHFNPSVITISSMSGIMSHAQGHFSYNASKAATIHLSKMMAYEFKDASIRVNSIAPGYFPSEMTTHGESNEDNKSELPKEKTQQKGHVPQMRPGKDEEMAMAVLFFAKNRYVNGEVIAVDGGVLLDVPAR